MKLSRKLFSATAALGLAVLATVGSTYAWFSMNTDVTATGMQVTTQVGDNLFISGDTTESNFEIGYHDVVGGILEPVSTIDGATFYYNSTKNAKGDGSAKNTSYILYNAGTAATDTANYNNAFSENYGVKKSDTAVAYVEDTYYLKATPSASSDNLYINLTECNLTYQGGIVGEKAWRIALFATEAKTTASAADGETPALVSINGLSGLDYFTSGKAVSGAAAKDSVASLNHAPSINADPLEAGATSYIKVVVRLWLEGEDKTCKNDTFANLTKDYRLELKFELEDAAATGSWNIGSAVSAAASGTGLTAKVTLTNTTEGNITNGETAASFQWYNAETGAEIASATEYSYTAASAMKVYCLVTTVRGNVYRTPNVDLE